METSISYKDSLDIIEKFMEESGLRNYCTYICKGKCCGICYTSKNACHKNEGRRISCSIFMCNQLNYLLNRCADDISIVNKDEFHKNYIYLFGKLRGYIYSHIEKTLQAYVGYNVYFKPHTKELIETIKFSKQLLELLLVDYHSVHYMAKSIKSCLEFMISNQHIYNIPLKNKKY